MELLGNLGQSPEEIVTQSGSTVLRLRLATTERRKKGEEWTDHTEWHSVVLFGKSADALAGKLSTGARLFVEGRLEYRTWDKQDGTKGYSTDIVANEVIVESWGRDANGPSDNRRERPAPKGKPKGKAEDDDYYGL